MNDDVMSGDKVSNSRCICVLVFVAGTPPNLCTCERTWETGEIRFPGTQIGEEPNTIPKFGGWSTLFSNNLRKLWTKYSKKQIDIG